MHIKLVLFLVFLIFCCSGQGSENASIPLELLFREEDQAIRSGAGETHAITERALSVYYPGRAPEIFFHNSLSECFPFVCAARGQECDPNDDSGGACDVGLCLFSSMFF